MENSSVLTNKGVRTITHANRTWYMGLDCAKVCGLQDTKKAVKDHVPASEKIRPSDLMVSVDELSFNQKNAWFLSWDGVCCMVSSARTLKAIGLAKAMRIKVFYKILKPELETMEAIRKAFPAEVFLTQYPCKYGEYFLDAYLPDHNIVLECDEHDHAGYDKGKEAMRSREIGAELKDPTFIRFNPHAQDFDIFTVIGRIQTAVRASLIAKSHC